jgi:hypothetical protein
MKGRFKMSKIMLTKEEFEKRQVKPYNEINNNDSPKFAKIFMAAVGVFLLSLVGLKIVSGKYPWE